MLRLAVVAAAALVAATAPASVTADAQPVRVLVVKATWAPQPFTDAEVQQVVFVDAATFFANASFGRVSIVGAQTPWLRTYTGPPPCNEDMVSSAQRTAAVNGYDTTAFDRVIYLLGGSVCPTPGGADVRIGRITLAGGLLHAQLVEHELGHTFGISQADAIACAGARCSRIPYGNPWDPMGSGPGDFGALQKACAGWLTDVTHVARRGVYTVDALELPSTGPQALVIETARHEYWVDHREAVGNDAFLADSARYPGITAGIAVHEAQPHAVQIPEPKRLPDAMLANGGRGGWIAGPGRTFTVPGIFALDVLSHRAPSVTVRFRWLDRTAPAAPAVTVPMRVDAGTRVWLAWRPARDTGSGVRDYVVRLDAQGPIVVAASSPLGVRLPPATRGRHTVAVHARDYAGNRGAVETRTFVAG